MIRNDLEMYFPVIWLQEIWNFSLMVGYAGLAEDS